MRREFEARRALVCRRLAAPPATLARALLPMAQVHVAQLGSDPVGGVMMLRHGRAATYFIGWNGPQGRRVHAHNLLLWQALLALKAQGVECLDLGGIDGIDMPGVARFKLGLGGRLFTLAGTYL